MGWNHRVLAHKDGDGVYFQIHEVHYNKENKPTSYSTEGIPVGSDSIKGIKWVLDKMIECTTEPILWAGENWPKEYKQ